MGVTQNCTSKIVNFTEYILCFNFLKKNGFHIHCEKDITSGCLGIKITISHNLCGFLSEEMESSLAWLFLYTYRFRKRNIVLSYPHNRVFVVFLEKKRSQAMHDFFIYTHRFRQRNIVFSYPCKQVPVGKYEEERKRKFSFFLFFFLREKISCTIMLLHKLNHLVILFLFEAKRI